MELNNYYISQSKNIIEIVKLINDFNSQINVLSI